MGRIGKIGNFERAFRSTAALHISGRCSKYYPDAFYRGLRSAGTASLALDQNSALKMDSLRKDEKTMNQGKLKEIPRSKKWGC